MAMRYTTPTAAAAIRTLHTPPATIGLRDPNTETAIVPIIVKRGYPGG
jgi:hypothetical protein